MKYVSEGNYEEAIIAFTVAIEIDPKKADAYISRGGAYIGSGEAADTLAAALADYQKAIELDEACADGYLGMADVYIRQGEYDKALEILETGLEKTGNDQNIADKIAAIEAGTISDSSGNIRRLTKYDADGNLLWYHEFTYDEEGRQSSVTSYDAAGSQTGFVNLTYTAEGYEQDTYYYYNTSGLVARIHNEYDASGNVIKYTRYEQDEEQFNYVLYEYDDSGNITVAADLNCPKIDGSICP